MTKRLQFRLLFLLLAITLFASLFSWRSAVDQKKRLDQESRRASREQLLVGQEKWLKQAEEDDYQVSDQTDVGKERRRKSRESELQKIEKEREQLRTLQP